MKMALLVLIVFMTIGVMLSSNLLAQFGIDKNYLLIGLGAVVITGLVAFRGLALIILMLLMTVAINLPEEFLNQYHLDQDVLMVAVILMVVFPLIFREIGKK